MYPKKEGTYNYYDRLDTDTNSSDMSTGLEIKPFGPFKAVKVAPED
jgi:hypothetical protein